MGTLDATEMATQLLDGLHGLKVGPMVIGELARRLVESGLAVPTPGPGPARNRGPGGMRGSFRMALRAASGGRIDVPVRFVRCTRARSGSLVTSYSGTANPDWNAMIDEIGAEAFAERVRQFLASEAGEGWKVTFGLGRKDSRTICLTVDEDAPAMPPVRSAADRT